MKLTLNRIAAVGVVAGALGLGGVGYAYAQSTSTTPPDTTAPADHGGGGGDGQSTSNCPNMGGSTNTSSADASQTSYMRH